MRIQNITDMSGNTPLLKIDDKIKYYAKIEGNHFICVVDPNITEVNRKIIGLLRK